MAEQRFMSNSHEWQFDNAWQEMLNHATIKVIYQHKYLLLHAPTIIGLVNLFFSFFLFFSSFLLVKL